MKSHFLKENDVVLSSRWQFQDGRSKGMGTEWDKEVIKTCRITDLLLKKEYKRAIASVEASLLMDPRLISTSTRNFMYCGLTLGYMAIGRFIRASEYLDKSLEIAGQDWKGFPKWNLRYFRCFPAVRPALRQDYPWNPLRFSRFRGASP